MPILFPQRAGYSAFYQAPRCAISGSFADAHVFSPFAYEGELILQIKLLPQYKQKLNLR